MSRWTVIDFALAWLGGLVGTFVLFGAGQLINLEDGLIVLGLAGQYLGNLGVLWALSRSKRDAPALGLSIEPKDLRFVGLGILIQIGAAILLEPLARMLFPDGRPPQEIAEIISDPSTSTMLKLTLFSAAVLLAPLTEELLFRGVLLRAIEPRGKWFTILVTSLVFALVHLVGLDAEQVPRLCSGGGPADLPPRHAPGVAHPEAWKAWTGHLPPLGMESASGARPAPAARAAGACELSPARPTDALRSWSAPP